MGFPFNYPPEDLNVTPLRGAEAMEYAMRSHFYPSPVIFLSARW